MTHAPRRGARSERSPTPGSRRGRWGIRAAGRERSGSIRLTGGDAALRRVRGRSGRIGPAPAHLRQAPQRARWARIDVASRSADGRRLSPADAELAVGPRKQCAQDIRPPLVAPAATVGSLSAAERAATQPALAKALAFRDAGKDAEARACGRGAGEAASIARSSDVTAAPHFRSWASKIRGAWDGLAKATQETAGPQHRDGGRALSRVANICSPRAARRECDAVQLVSGRNRSWPRTPVPRSGTLVD